MKTVALIDAYTGGHHLMYLRLFSKLLLDSGQQVIAFCPNPDPLTSWIKLHSQDNFSRFRCYKIDEPEFEQLPVLKRLPQPIHILLRWRQASKLIERAENELDQSIDLVFFNWLDAYLSAYLGARIIDAIFPHNWSGLWFQPKFNSPGQRNRKSTLCSYFNTFNSQRCCGVGVLDQGIASHLQQHTSTAVITFPDITDDAPPDQRYSVARELHEASQGKQVIGLVGSLHKRKGFLTLLATALASSSEPWIFAFIGQLSTHSFDADELAYIQNILGSAPSNCFFHLASVPDEPQFNAVIQACDILFAAYENFPYSSNILTKAAIFEKPVIATQGFCIGERVEQYGMGLTIPTGDAAACFAAIQAICNASDQPNPPGTAFAVYRRDYSPLRIIDIFEKLLANV